MANLEQEGRISVKLPVQSGNSARGPWERQDFVIEYQDGNFPTQVCFTAWGQDKVAELTRFQVGDSVKVAFNIRGREYNGKWYNDLRIWRISPVGAGAPAAAAPAYPEAPAYPSAPAYEEAPAPGIQDLDDLPF